MGTVGLSFGSATSGQGFDVSSTVTSILALSQAIETPWKTQLTKLQAQDTALSSLGTDLSSLSTSLQSLTDFEGVLAEKSGSSSNTNVIALDAADSTATAGNHAVTVSQLAQTSSVFSSVVANAGDTLAGSLSIQVGSGTAQTITVDSSSNTLSSLAAAINRAGVGVTASIVSDSAGSRLSLVSDTGGSAGQLTVSSELSDATTGASVTTQAGETGQDAQFNVDGVALTSGSNTVTTAIPGVTFQLLSTSSAATQVVIANNTADATTALSTFVTAYNKVVGDLKTQEGNDASGNAEPLFGSPTLSLVQSQLSGALFGGVASGSVSSLTQLGVSVNQDGTLTFSSSSFTSALNANFNDVVGFFQNTGSFGSNFQNVLDGLGNESPTGALSLAQNENSTTEKGLNTNVSNEEALLATEKTTLTTELNTANEELQAIPSQLNLVNEMYSSISGYGKISG